MGSGQLSRLRSHLPLPTGAELYGTEVVGTIEAMKPAKVRVTANPDIREIILFLDNSAVVDGILGTTPASSQGAYMGLRKAVKELQPQVITKVAGPGAQGHPRERNHRLASQERVRTRMMPIKPLNDNPRPEMGQEAQRSDQGANLGRQTLFPLQTMVPWTHRPCHPS
ncbi:hypothetical protein V8C42DRAFT_338089 [Trichoderma barbatum]